MIDIKYEGLEGTGLITAPLNRTSNLSECNFSHDGIDRLIIGLWCVVGTNIMFHALNSFHL